MGNFFEQFFVITGASGSGKTTLLHSLEDRYFRIVQDGSPYIIEDQIAIGGKALPWENQQAYADLMLNWNLRSYRETPKQYKQPVIFDRGIPDIIAYLEFHNLSIPAHLMNAAEKFRYNKKVFIAPFWDEVFQKNASRQESVQDAKKALDVILSVYKRFGYEPYYLPKKNLDSRVQFIKDTING